MSVFQSEQSLIFCIETFSTIHVQHAAGNQAAGEDEEAKSAADDPVFQSVHDSGPGGWLRGRVQGLESPFPLGCILHRTLSAAVKVGGRQGKEKLYDTESCTEMEVLSVYFTKRHLNYH
ncbi:hypothetical protein E2986_12513 [Frieseomelitta varia]|uniref:Uncharacterized protein n=1 Tax=Frieseomelitta varia TaxID=561572 RepID=A0A833W9N6_9HYME|nr:hypothetical protein E2986_12513 [Frieseomelitta varia]